MSYSEFTLNKTVKDFGLTLDQDAALFEKTDEITVSDFLQKALTEYAPLAVAINTEKARSELLIMPVLMELHRLSNPQISLFSGIDFKVEPDQGLTGYCDYIIAQSPIQFFLNAPLLMLVEAKKEDLIAGLGQCAAEMVAAQIFNDRENKPIPVIYGAVTSGSNWRFLKLQGKHLTVEAIEHTLEPVGKLLGILLEIAQSANGTETKDKTNGINPD